jgi:hypothetical protein
VSIRNACWALGLLVGVAILTACGSSPDRSTVSDVAARFVGAVQSKHGATACALLTTEAAQSISGATNVSCPDAVVNVDEQGAGVRGVQVWGDEAQVKIGIDVVFLRHFPTGWKVRAAGCKPRPGAAYNCDVEG